MLTNRESNVNLKNVFDRALEPKRASFRTPCIVFVYDVYILINKLTLVLCSPESKTKYHATQYKTQGTIFQISLVRNTVTQVYRMFLFCKLGGGSLGSG